MVSDIKKRNFDCFDKGKFSWRAWSAPVLFSPAEIRKRLDVLRLEGRKITDLKLVGLNYCLSYYHLESLLLKEPDESGNNVQSIDLETLIGICAEIDEPMLIRFEDGLIGRRMMNINVGPGMKPGPKTVCIPNALVSERFEKECPSRDAVRGSLSLSGTDTLVLLFGWTPYVKGVDVACEAVRKIVESGHADWKLGIICGREMTTDKMPDWINGHTGLSGNEDWILCLPPTERIGDYLAASDLMLSASRSETFSYSVLEALWFGKRCVISDIPGTEWAASYPSVSVFRSGDPVSCSNVLLSSSVSEYPDRDSLKRRISADYALEDWTKQVLSVYDSLCE